MRYSINKGPKNCILNTAEHIGTGKNLKVKGIDLCINNKYIAYHPEFPLGIISSLSFINIETMDIISSDAEITENYFLGIKSIELFAI